MMTSNSPFSVPTICSEVTVPFSQTLVANLDNSFDIKHALVDGSVPFHNHPDNDEAFYLLSGSLTIQISQKSDMAVAGEDTDIRDVEMKVGDLFVVPKGVYHRPVGAKAHVLVMEKTGVPGGNGQLAKET
jgi:mannose-6-phosphate isomerase-like protein (cupin superfamily)